METCSTCHFVSSSIRPLNYVDLIEQEGFLIEDERLIDCSYYQDNPNSYLNDTKPNQPKLNSLAQVAQPPPTIPIILT